jgi:hypothetical protein
VSQPEGRYQLSIKAFDVPDRLKGAPVSIEIIPEQGNARRTSLTLSDTASLQPVDGPGNYVVRATLPSGRLIADRATVPPQADGIAFGEAALDFGEPGPTHDRLVLDVAPGDRIAQRPAGWSFGSAIRGLLGLGNLPNFHIIQISSPSYPSVPPRLKRGETAFEWGTFDGWKPDGSGMAIRRRGSGVVDACGRIVAPSTNHPPGYPLLFKAVPPHGRENVLFICTADNSREEMTLAADPDGGLHRSGAPAVVSRDHAEPVTATLFAYVRAGALEQAKSGVSVLTEMLTPEGAQEGLGPDAATMAAYVLQKFRRPEAARIVDGRTSKYPDLPDLHIIQGMLRISEGKAETAADHFNTALDHGVPCYTEGVRMMRDGLNFLADLYPTEQSIRSNARRANSLAAAANFNSEMTCLRLGQDITADFS